MEKEKLQDKWQEYGRDKLFNYSKIQHKITDEYPVVTFEPKSSIVVRGDFPEYVYFILSGVAVGTRNYQDGNEYDYFQLSKSNGSIGLLEILAQKEQMIATVTSLSKVRAIRVPANVVYGWVMEDIELLRLSANLLAEDLYHRSSNDGLFYRYKGIDRLRHFLVSYYDEHSKDKNGVVEVFETREKIGNKMGLSVRTVGRSLKRLRDNQEIMSSDRKTMIGKKEYQRLKAQLIQL